MAIVSADCEFRLTALTGGVSSDIYRVDAGNRTFCVKRALRKLKVAGDWQAPVTRNRSEVAWLRHVSARFPGRTPEIVGDDPEGGTFAMAWFPPERYPTWKALLRDGSVDGATANAVGDLLGKIHAGSADQPEVASEFANEEIFHAIRLEPYLIATGRAHPDLATRFTVLVETTQAHRRVLVHGDYSPKNILAGADGPVVIDAECACFGDPAFDVAFVLNHLLLKSLWRPQWKERYVESLHALVEAYRHRVTWEPWPSLEARVAALLPALLLARVDGKSPVEYLTDDNSRKRVRNFARPRIVQPPATVGAIVSDWVNA